MLRTKFINIFFNGNIVKIKNPLDKILQISGYTFNYIGDNKPMTGVIAQEIEALAFAGDKSIECFKHNKYKIMGIMWHPERYNKLRKFETEILKNFLRSILFLISAGKGSRIFNNIKKNKSLININGKSLIEKGAKVGNNLKIFK